MLDLRTAPYAALLLRLTNAVLFAAHLYFKVGIRGIPATVSYFQSLGYPGFFAYLDMTAEAVVIVLFLFGIYTRWASIVMLPLMVCATMVFFDKGWNFTTGGFEFPATWTIILIVQFLLGDGAAAVKVPALPWERRLGLLRQTGTLPHAPAH